VFDPETPPPDERVYFHKDQFELVDETYDPVVSDSENELCLMKFGKRKAKAWPRTDHGFEHSKTKIRKTITRLRRHLQEVPAHHKKFKRAKKNEIVDSDDDDVFNWVRWLNAQSGKDFVKARIAARAGAHHLGANANDEKGADISNEIFCVGYFRRARHSLPNSQFLMQGFPSTRTRRYLSLSLLPSHSH